MVDQDLWHSKQETGKEGEREKERKRGKGGNERERGLLKGSWAHYVAVKLGGSWRRAAGGKKMERKKRSPEGWQGHHAHCSVKARGAQLPTLLNKSKKRETKHRLKFLFRSRGWNPASSLHHPQWRVHQSRRPFGGFLSFPPSTLLQLPPNFAMTQWARLPFGGLQRPSLPLPLIPPPSLFSFSFSLHPFFASSNAIWNDIRAYWTIPLANQFRL